MNYRLVHACHRWAAEPSHGGTRDVPPGDLRHAGGDRHRYRRRCTAGLADQGRALAGDLFRRADPKYAFLVQIFFLFFALPLIGIRLAPTPTAIMPAPASMAAPADRDHRGWRQSIPKGQMEAGLALGLHKAQVFRLIILKPALRTIYPSLTSQFVLLTLSTSIASAISAYELTSVSQRIEIRKLSQLRSLFHGDDLLPRHILADDAHSSRSSRPVISPIQSSEVTDMGSEEFVFL